MAIAFVVLALLVGVTSRSNTSDSIVEAAASQSSAWYDSGSASSAEVTE